MADGYPTTGTVEAADVEELLRWTRFLPSPRDDDQVALLHLISKRLGEERTKDNAAYVAASKRIGW